MSNYSLTKFEKEQFHKNRRYDRFDKGIYGEILQPVVQKGVIAYYEPPTYLNSRNTVKRYNYEINNSIDLSLDKRCFYTGIVSWADPKNVSTGYSQDPKIIPWMGTKDHLVPARRFVPNCPIVIGNYNCTKVWCSNIANVTLGLVPLPIRLKIRNWLSTTPYPRDDISIEAGHNIKWLIISMLDDFRINGRYPWSRNKEGKWWYPNISEPLMKKWWKMEIEFLSLNDEERNKWINNFVYQF